MLKAFGKTLFLLFSVSVLVVIFIYDRKDANEPSVEVEPGFTITTTTEPVSTTEETTTEGALNTTVVPESEVAVTHSNEPPKEKTLTETTTEDKTTQVIETRVWFQDENISSDTTSKKKGDTQ